MARTPNGHCLYCESPIYIRPSRLGRKNFCNRACHKLWTKSTSTAIGEYICLNCNQPFMRLVALQQRNKRPFCCRKCWAAWRSKNEKGEEHPLYAEVELACAYCGSPVRRKNHHTRKHPMQFCDQKCRGAWLSQNVSGENHPNWKGGWDPYYGPNWRSQRKKARERDNHTCQICGATREELGRELDVHHVKAFREFGYIKDENKNYRAANRLDNLISLCSSCHHKVENGILILS